MRQHWYSYAISERSNCFIGKQIRRMEEHKRVVTSCFYFSPTSSSYSTPTGSSRRCWLTTSLDKSAKLWSENESKSVFSVEANGGIRSSSASESFLCLGMNSTTFVNLFQ